MSFKGSVRVLRFSGEIIFCFYSGISNKPHNFILCERKPP